MLQNGVLFCIRDNIISIDDLQVIMLIVTTRHLKRSYLVHYLVCLIIVSGIVSDMMVD